MDTAVVPAPDVTESLRDHEQSFHPTLKDAPAPVVERADDGIEEPETAEQTAQRERDEKSGQFRPKQRAKSQQAGKEDVGTINALTKRVREAEEALGITVERQDGESDRVYNLRRRAEILEAKKEVARQEAKPVPAVVKPTGKAPEPFNEPEPQYEDFAHEPDQYQAHLRALTAWDRRKDTAEQAAKRHEAQTFEAITARNKQRDEWFQARESEHLDRMRAYHTAHPDAQAIIDAAGDISISPAVYSAIMTAKNSPDLLMLVAQNEDLRDDMNILTEGKPLNQELVALVQRRLNRGLTAADTGSAPVPAQHVPAVPRPPNPVRTGPMKSAATPPGDEDNLAAHEKFYGVRR